MGNDLLPDNCWVSGTGNAHPVERGKHAKEAYTLAGVSPSCDSEEALTRMYEHGWVRIQWESPRRINVAFHYLTTTNAARLRELIDFLLCSGVSVYLLGTRDDVFLEPDDNRWRTKFNRVKRECDLTVEKDSLSWET